MKNNQYSLINYKTHRFLKLNLQTKVVNILYRNQNLNIQYNFTYNLSSWYMFNFNQGKILAYIEYNENILYQENYLSYSYQFNKLHIFHLKMQNRVNMSNRQMIQLKYHNQNNLISSINMKYKQMLCLMDQGYKIQAYRHINY